MPTFITFSVSEDTLNSKANALKLEQEIRASSDIPDGVLAFVQVGFGGDPDVIHLTLGRDLTQPELDAITAVVAAHTGESPEAEIATVALDVQKDSKKRPFFIPWVTEGSRTTKISHRWNDPTTWVTQATQHTEQACPAILAGTTYQMPHTNIIDVCHGKLWEEEKLISHHVSVEVDSGGGWVAMTEKDPHDGVGDFEINYATGVITFAGIDAAASVRASYYAAGGSKYILEPSAGKSLLIKSAEVQFSNDIILNDTVVFETFGFVDVFAPHLMPGIPSGTRIPLKKTVYKTLHQFIDESNGSYPTIPAIGGNTWRGIHEPITVFPWNYAAALPLSSAAGMQVHIYCEHDVPFVGSYATATFYCLSEDETQ